MEGGEEKNGTCDLITLWFSKDRGGTGGRSKVTAALLMLWVDLRSVASSSLALKLINEASVTLLTLVTSLLLLSLDLFSSSGFSMGRTASKTSDICNEIGPWFHPTRSTSWPSPSAFNGLSFLELNSITQEFNLNRFEFSFNPFITDFIRVAAQ